MDVLGVERDRGGRILHFPLEGLASRGESQTMKPSGLCEG